MKLSVLERILLGELLPKVGSFTNLKLLRVVKEDLSFSEKENMLLDFTQQGELTKWKLNAVGDKSISIGEVASKLIRDKILELNKQEKLTESHLTICEKFNILDKEFLK